MSEWLDRYNAISPQKKAIGLAAVVLVLGYLGYSDEIVPAQEALESAQAQAAALEREIVELQEINKSLAAINEELRRAEEEMATLRSILPESSNVDQLLATLAGAAKTTGVKITSFEPTEEEQPAIAAAPPPPDTPPAADAGAAAGAGAGEVQKEAPPPIAYSTQINIEVMGNYGQIVSFFDRTLQLDRILHLTGFEIQVEDKEAEQFMGSRTLRAASTFLAYSQKPPLLASGKDGLKNDDPYGTKARERRKLQEEQNVSEQNVDRTLDQAALPVRDRE